MTAIRAAQPMRGTLVDGSTVFAAVGDWVVYGLTGQQVIGVIPADKFPGPYEVVAEGTLTLQKPDRELIEETAGIGSTQSVPELIGAVRRLAGISIGDVRIPFTPGQLEELTLRARKRGQTVQQAIEAVVARIRDELFHRG